MEDNEMIAELIREKHLKCSHCNGEIEAYDCININDNDSVIDKFMLGKCIDCGKEYCWIERYALTEITDFADYDINEF